MEIGNIMIHSGNIKGTVFIKFNPLSNTVLFTRYNNCSTYGVVPSYISDLLLCLQKQYDCNSINQNYGQFGLCGIDGTTKIITIIPDSFKDNSIHEAVVFGLKWSLDDINKHTFFRSLEEFVSFIQDDFMKEHKELMIRKLTDTLKLETLYSDVLTCNKMVKEIDIKVENLNQYKTGKLQEDIEAIHEELDMLHDVHHNDVLDLTKYIKNVEEDVMSTIHKDIKVFLETYQKKHTIYKDSNVNITELNHENILDECVAFHKSNSPMCNSDILSTIKLMLNSKKYILSTDFKSNKLNLHDISFEYKMLTKPDDITREELLDVIFNINNSLLI